MSLTVLSVAYPFAPVRPDTAGGAEQVLGALDAALVAAGHRSIVIASAGSQVAGQCIATEPASGTIDDAARERAWSAHRRAIARALATHSIDVVHFHGIDFHACLPPPGDTPLLATLHLPPAWYPPEVFADTRCDLHLHGVDFHAYLPAPGDTPLLATLHLPPAWYPPEVFADTRCDLHLHGVSRTQHAACPPSARLLPPIANGVPVQALGARLRKRGYAIALGRICPEKNLHAALDAGQRAGVPVLLAGQVFPYEAHERYFRAEIAPRLDATRRFLGPLSFARKRLLLAGARCLLLPTLAPETSSLVAMEAIASGTPVVAFASGAVPEIVEHGITGFLVRDAQEMADAIRACAALDPARCRAIARERFPLDAMVRRYFDLYRQLTHARQPRPRDALALS